MDIDASFRRWKNENSKDKLNHKSQDFKRILNMDNEDLAKNQKITVRQKYFAD